MYIFRNALKSITRSIGRNALIGIIVFVIAMASCISLAIGHAASVLQEQGIQKQYLTATINIDREKLMSSLEGLTRQEIRTEMQKYQALTLDELRVYAQSTAITEFTYTISSAINASGDLEPYVSNATATESTAATPTPTPTPTPTKDNQENQNNPGNNENSGGGRGQMGERGDFNIVGYSSESAMTSFVKGNSKITDGQMFEMTSSDPEILISSDLATFNELTVGDVITLANPNQSEETYSMVIVGIFTNTNTNATDSGVNFDTAQDPANQIYMSFSALQTIVNQSIQDATVLTTTNNGDGITSELRVRSAGSYLVPNVEAFEQFKIDAVALGLGEFYTVTSSDISSYEQSLVPLQNLRAFANTMLWIVLAIGAIILMVLTMFNIRERKYEIGVLTAIGMKKYKVAIQLVSEIFIVTLIALLVGAAIGSLFSVSTANNLLADQITAEQAIADEQNANFGRGEPDRRGPGGLSNNSKVKYINNIDAIVNLDVLLQLLGIGALLTLFTSFFSLLYVMRYEPLKILQNRS